MELNKFVLIGYGAFLLIMLVVNMLYIFQVYKYRLPGDASIAVMSLHILLIVGLLTLSSVLVLG